MNKPNPPRRKRAIDGYIPDMKQTSVRIPKKTYQATLVQAKREESNVTEIINHALRIYLREMGHNL